ARRHPAEATLPRGSDREPCRRLPVRGGGVVTALATPCQYRGILYRPITGCPQAGCGRRPRKRGSFPGDPQGLAESPVEEMRWICEHVLLLHHGRLDRWLQPGGHGEGERDPRVIALRELEEETGLRGLRPFPDARILDVDVHLIPARPGEPE